MKKNKTSREEKREQIRRDLEKSMKDLEKQIKDLEESGMIDPNNVKIVRISLPQLNPKRKFLFKIIDVLASILLFFGLSGYINWLETPNIWYFLITGGIFIALEIGIRELLDLIFPKFTIYSLGAYTIIASIASFIISVLVSPKVSINSSFTMAIFFIIYLVIRVIFKSLLMKKFAKEEIIRFGDKK